MHATPASLRPRAADDEPATKRLRPDGSTPAFRSRPELDP